MINASRQTVLAATSLMTSVNAAYELLLFLVNNLQTNAEIITAQVITDSAPFESDPLMFCAWQHLDASGRDEIAADVHHVLDGISRDLATLF